ncbi:hypothetical protein FQN60_000963 [Etheostoma spectabile]|uniref:Uncharacterized protein n=1 Tax=Etheostoma spectabile TaxID=54343 RepID=A0A5J5CZN4_9PERO|nr:hypothetical protein FQN60_000963 [Etheostoma spectabile]
MCAFYTRSSPCLPPLCSCPTGSASSTLVDDKGMFFSAPPTLEALPESNLGSIGGAVAGPCSCYCCCLWLRCYLRKQQPSTATLHQDVPGPQ